MPTTTYGKVGRLLKMCAPPFFDFLFQTFHSNSAVKHLPIGAHKRITGCDRKRQAHLFMLYQPKILEEYKMIKNLFIIALLATLPLFSILGAQGASKPAELKVPQSLAYLGQTPPGDTAIVFAPDFISTPNHFVGNAAFSPDGQEFYFSITNANWDSFELMTTKFKNGEWTIPIKAGFVKEKFSLEPFFSADGSRIYFNAGDASNLDLWFCEKKSEGWAVPVKLSESINTPAMEWFPSLSKKNTLFFTRDGGIYYSLFQDGRHKTAIKIENPNSSGKDENADPFISPNEDYLIFMSINQAEGLGQADLYISFKKQDGTWTPGRNLGPRINSSEYEFGPALSPDGKYFFFSRREKWLTQVPSKIYWIKADFIKEL